MEAKKQNKRKLVIALALLAVIVVASVVTTVVLVLAASQQNVSSTINVTYTSREVSGTVTAAFSREDANPATNGGFTSMGSHTFTGGDTTTTAQLNTSATDITLGGYFNQSSYESTSDGVGEMIDYVIFRYTFTNSSTSSAYTAVLSYTDTSTTDTNVTFSIWNAVSSTNLVPSTTTEVPIATLRSTGASDSTPTAGWTDVANPGSNIATITIAANSNATTYVYLKVRITDGGVNNAIFSGNFAWVLNGPPAV